MDKIDNVLIDGEDAFRGLIEIEFDVKMTSDCLEEVIDAVSKVGYCKKIDVNAMRQSVIVTTAVPHHKIQKAIESTGRKAVLKGIGTRFQAAAATIKNNIGVCGVIRFNQTCQDCCVIDGVIDGLPPGEHGLHIHEYGDLSGGFNSIGGHYNPEGKDHGGPSDENRHYGDLGNIVADANGRATFRLYDSVVRTHSLIGRSIVITEKRDDMGKTDNGSSKIDGNSGLGLAVAVIAKSAGKFENPKRLCQCDGISIWDETVQPGASS